MEDISVESGEQPIGGQLGKRVLQTSNLGAGQAADAGFELDESDLDRVGIPRPDAYDHGVDDSRARGTSGTVEEHDLPPVLPTPLRQGAFARPFALGGSVPSAPACHPGSYGSAASGMGAGDLHEFVGGVIVAVPSWRLTTPSSATAERGALAAERWLGASEARRQEQPA